MFEEMLFLKVVIGAINLQRGVKRKLILICMQASTAYKLEKTTFGYYTRKNPNSWNILRTPSHPELPGFTYT